MPNDVRFLMVGLGDVDAGTLIYIEEATGGTYEATDSSVDLTNLFEGFFASIAHDVVPTGIWLRERVNTDAFEVMDGSWDWGGRTLIPEANELESFVSSGMLNLHVTPLAANTAEVFSFSVRAKPCLPPDAPEDFVTILPNLPYEQGGDGSQVDYNWGQVPSHAELTEVEVNCYKEENPRLRKDYDEFSKEVTLKIKSGYAPSSTEDRIIRNVEVFEFTSPFVQHVIGTSNPDAKLIPGPITDLLYWHIGDLAPQEEKELRFKVDLRAYLPRDSNPLWVNLTAVKDPLNVKSYATYVLPGESEVRQKKFPQEFFSVTTLELVPGNRPDLYIEPALSVGEFREFPPEPSMANLSASPRIPAGGPVADWSRFLTLNLFKRSETPSIWIDSEENGFVDQWTNYGSTNPHLTGAEHDQQTGRLRKVYGQGDLIRSGHRNRICVELRNTGHGQAGGATGAITINARNYTTSRWDTIAVVARPMLRPLSSRIVCTEPIGSDIISSHHYERFGPSSWGIGIATLKVTSATADKEKHTLNNEATERALLVP